MCEKSEEGYRNEIWEILEIIVIEIEVESTKWGESKNSKIVQWNKLIPPRIPTLRPQQSNLNPPRHHKIIPIFEPKQKPHIKDNSSPIRHKRGRKINKRWQHFIKNFNSEPKHKQWQIKNKTINNIKSKK